MALGDFSGASGAPGTRAKKHKIFNILQGPFKRPSSVSAMPTTILQRCSCQVMVSTLRLSPIRSLFYNVRRHEWQCQEGPWQPPNTLIMFR